MIKFQHTVSQSLSGKGTSNYTNGPKRSLDNSCIFTYWGTFTVFALTSFCGKLDLLFLTTSSLPNLNTGFRGC